MSKKYDDLKPIISKYKKVLVTGPHGAGNKITAHVIAHDLGIPYIRGEETWRHYEYWEPEPKGLLTYHDKMKNQEWSMFAPSQSSHLQNILEFLDDVLVVFMYKDIDQIKDYSTRNRFVRNHTHSYEWTTHMEIIDKQYPELSYLKNWEIEEMTYFLWETKQKKLIPNWIEIEHSSLETHELWVPREKRRHFKEWQISEDEITPQETKEMDSKFFIEIGVSDFNTLEQLLSNGWRGVMVEPLDMVYDKLPTHPNLTKDKVAIDTKNGFADFWVVENTDIWQNPQEVIGMSCLVDSPGALHGDVYLNRKKTIQVQTMRLDTLLEKHRVTRIDLLKIDVEGKDVEILLDYSFIIKPSVIKFEHIHYSGKEYNASEAGFDQKTMTKKYESLLEKLKNMGYIVWEEHNDVYCVL